MSRSPAYTLSTTIINCLLILTITTVKCELLFWGHQHLHNVPPSPLRKFDNNDMNVLIEILRPTSVIAFVVDNRTSSLYLQRDNGSLFNEDFGVLNNRPIAKLKMPLFRQLVENSMSVYVPQNLPIYIGNFTVGKFCLLFILLYFECVGWGDMYMRVKMWKNLA